MKTIGYIEYFQLIKECYAVFEDDLKKEKIYYFYFKTFCQSFLIKVNIIYSQCILSPGFKHIINVHVSL